MAYKQPNVPKMREGEEHLPALTRFLQDFCLEAWQADRKKDAEIAGLKRRLESLEAEAAEKITNG